MEPFGHVAPTMDRMREAGRDIRILRIARPGRMIAFSRRDERMPGFASAVAVAEAHGFAASVRPVGGTFAPVREGSLVVDEFGWTSGQEWPQQRFDRHAELLAEVFASYGIDARVGEVAGEYCPGAHSVNRGGVAKLSGTAQRVSRGAWLVSSVVQVEAVGALLPVTEAVAAALSADIDLATIGALSDTVPGITVEEVASRIAERFHDDGVTEIERLGV